MPDSSSTSTSGSSSNPALARSQAAQAPTSKRAFGPLSGLPCSRDSRAASASAASSTASAARFSTSARSAGVFAAHSRCAARAVSIARSRSSVVLCGARPTSLPVAGSIISTPCPSGASIAAIRCFTRDRSVEVGSAVMVVPSSGGLGESASSSPPVPVPRKGSVRRPTGRRGEGRAYRRNRRGRRRDVWARSDETASQRRGWGHFVPDGGGSDLLQRASDGGQEPGLGVGLAVLSGALGAEPDLRGR